MNEMVRAIVTADELDALNASIDVIAKAIAKNFFPIIKKHIALTVQYDKDCFEGALVDAITDGEGPISSLELLEKVKEASERIKDLVSIQSDRSYLTKRKK